MTDFTAYYKPIQTSKIFDQFNKVQCTEMFMVAVLTEFRGNYETFVHLDLLYNEAICHKLVFLVTEKKK